MTRLSRIFLPDAKVRRRETLGRRWWRLWLLTAELAAIAGIVYLYQQPVWKLKAVAYDGPAGWEDAARACIVVPVDSNYLHLDLAAMRATLEATFGARADAAVRLALPSGLSVRVTPTEPELWMDAAHGVALSGAIIAEPPVAPDVPIWTSTIPKNRVVWRTSTDEAAGLWAQITGVDRRFRDVISEWRFTAEDGWSATARDGRTRFIFGRTRIAERGQIAAEMLARSDSLFHTPCVIDLRYDGRVVVRPRTAFTNDSYRIRESHSELSRRQDRPAAIVEGEGA